MERMSSTFCSNNKYLLGGFLKEGFPQGEIRTTLNEEEEENIGKL